MAEFVKILLIDDDADDRELFLESVRELHGNIICCTVINGEEAMDFLNESYDELPDFIFLDLKMPKLDGRKFLTQVKQNSFLKHIPIIVYTTSTNVNDATELTALGASHFVSKPMNYEEIYFLLSLTLEEIKPA